MLKETDLDAIDRIIGADMRFHRLRRGVSQAKRASRIGISFQQLQKYERGVNRISASRLLQIAETLAVFVVALFDEARSSDAKSPTNVPTLPNTTK